jgi:hypothetical protein
MTVVWFLHENLLSAIFISLLLMAGNYGIRTRHNAYAKFYENPLIVPNSLAVIFAVVRCLISCLATCDVTRVAERAVNNS